MVKSLIVHDIFNEIQFLTAFHQLCPLINGRYTQFCRICLIIALL